MGSTWRQMKKRDQVGGLMIGRRGRFNRPVDDFDDTNAQLSVSFCLLKTECDTVRLQ